MDKPPSLKPLHWVGSSKRFAFLAGATPKADIDLVRERLKAAEQIAKELQQ